MSYVMGTVTVPGSSTVAAFVVPPGYCNVTFYQPTQAQAVYLGTSSRVSATSGMLLTASPASTDSVLGTGGVTWYATTGNNTAATFCYLISAAN